MEFTPTAIPDIVRITPRVFPDSRGHFMETYEERKFAAAGIHARFVQDNHSSSSRWVLRGLHSQIQQAQGKLVRVISGEVFDVAVDVRRSSPTFGKWIGEILSGENHRMLWIPPGFAHGFLVLSERAEFSYKCTDFYAPQHERSLLWNDPALNIAWPLPAGVQPVLGAKDAAAPPLSGFECYP